MVEGEEEGGGWECERVEGDSDSRASCGRRELWTTQYRLKGRGESVLW